MDILSINLLLLKQIWVMFLSTGTKGVLIDTGLKLKTVTQDWEIQVNLSMSSLPQWPSTTDCKYTIYPASEPITVLCTPSTKAGIGLGNSILSWVFLRSFLLPFLLFLNSKGWNPRTGTQALFCLYLLFRGDQSIPMASLSISVSVICCLEVNFVIIQTSDLSSGLRSPIAYDQPPSSQFCRHLKLSMSQAEFLIICQSSFTKICFSSFMPFSVYGSECSSRKPGNQPCYAILPHSKCSIHPQLLSCLPHNITWNHLFSPFPLLPLWRKSPSSLFQGVQGLPTAAPAFQVSQLVPCLLHHREPLEM